MSSKEIDDDLRNFVGIAVAFALFAGVAQTIVTGNAGVSSTWAFFALGLVVIYLLYRLVDAVETVAYENWKKREPDGSKGVIRIGQEATDLSMGQRGICVLGC